MRDWRELESLRFYLSDYPDAKLADEAEIREANKTELSQTCKEILGWRADPSSLFLLQLLQRVILAFKDQMFPEEDQDLAETLEAVVLTRAELAGWYEMHETEALLKAMQSLLEVLRTPDRNGPPMGEIDLPTRVYKAYRRVLEVLDDPEMDE